MSPDSFMKSIVSKVGSKGLNHISELFAAILTCHEIVAAVDARGWVLGEYLQ